jgi:hypothetical protein
MQSNAAQILLSFPPRPLGDAERALFNEWLSRAGDISLAYVSERRSDDPRHYRRIVIWADPGGRPMCTIHAPSAGTNWLVTSTDQPTRVEIFDNLRDALNSIRAVLI